MEFSYFFIICNIFNAYLLFRYLSLFFDRKGTNTKIELLSYLLFYCIDTSLFLLRLPIAVTSINYAIFVFLLSLNYKGRLSKRLVSTLLIFITWFGIEGFVYLMAGYIEVNFLAENQFSSISGLIIIQILSLAFLTILNRFSNLKYDLVLPKKSWLLVFLLPLFSIYIILLITQVGNGFQMQAAIGMLALLFINFAIFYLYQSIISSLNSSVENTLIKEQNTSYLKQLEIMKNNNDSIEVLEHDLIHKMFSMKTLLAEGKIEQCINYINKYLELLENKEVFSTTGNFVFDSIINYKLSLARQKKIEPLLMIMLPPQLSFEPLDISALLGNLLDNAISAVEKCDGDRWIDIDIRCDKGFLIIKIKNPYTGEMNYINGEIITTKRSNNKKHGIGLRSVYAIIEKYDGVWEIRTDNNLFQFDLLLVLEKC